jgi:hypothetical protein
MKKLLLASGIGLALFVMPVMVLATADQYPYSTATPDQYPYAAPALGGSNSASGVTPSLGNSNSASGVTPTPTYSSSANSGSSGVVVNPLGSINSFCGLIKALLGAAVAIGIPIAVLFIVYAGFKFVMARGKPEDLVQARTNMLWTMIGIGIFLGAWLLAMVISNTVNGLASGSGQTVISSCN